MANYILAVTGASGTVYARRLLDYFLEQRIVTHLVISKAAQLVAGQELGRSWVEILADNYSHQLRKGKIRFWDIDDFSAPIASGSYPSKGMVVIPTSMATLAGIAQGLSANLLQRAADIMLKEKKPLVLVPRETPLSSIHLKNMLALCQAGVHIVPPVPAFYNHPQNLQDIINFAVGRVLDVLGMEHRLYPKWGEDPASLFIKGGMSGV